MHMRRLTAVLLLGMGLTAFADAPTSWFDAIWLSDSKQRGTRGACAGEYEENNSLDLTERTDHTLSGEYTLNMSFFSDKHSSAQCDESDDNVATLDITYKVGGLPSKSAEEVAFDSTLKKCEEDGSYHACDSAPRQMRWVLRKIDQRTVVLVGDLAGTSKRTLQLHTH